METTVVQQAGSNDYCVGILQARQDVKVRSGKTLRNVNTMTYGLFDDHYRGRTWLSDEGEPHIVLYAAYETDTLA